MIRRRYRIEANRGTLIRFLQAMKTGSFVQRVTTDVNEEYYHVVVIGDPKAHDELLKLPFGRDSIALNQ